MGDLKMNRIINSEVNSSDFANLSDNSVLLDPFLTTINSIGKFYFIPELSKELIARLQLNEAGTKMGLYMYHAMENILTNLLIAHGQDKYVSVNLNSNKYAYYKKKQGLKYYSYRRYRKILKALECEEYIQLFIGFYNHDDIIRSRKTRIIPTEKLLQLCKQYPPQNILWIENEWISPTGKLCGISPCARDFHKVPCNEKIILKNNAKECLSYKNTKSIWRMKKQIAEYDEMMNECTVSLPCKAVIYRHADNEEILQLKGFESQVEQLELVSRIPENNLSISTGVLKDYRHEYGEETPVVVLESINDRQHAVWLTDILQDKDSTIDWIYDCIGSIYIPPIDEAIGVTHDPRYDSTIIYGSSGVDRRGLLETSVAGSSGVGTTTTITNNNLRISFIYKELDTLLYRVFSRSSFKFGGRYYGAEYQQLSKKARSLIHIDGKPTVEIDIDHIHPTILWAENGLELKEDIYALERDNKLIRKAVKLLFNIGLNAKNRASAIGAFTQHLKNKPMMREEISRLYGCVRNLWDTFLKKYPLVKNFLGKDYGIKAQFVDSQVAEKVLLTFTNLRIPVLCIHDSFIVQEEHAELLDRTIKTSFLEIVGVECTTNSKS